MFIKSLLKQHSHRTFDYRPRHYDSTRDKINEKRIQKGYDAIESNASSELKRINFRNNIYDSKKFRASGNTSLRIAIIFVILCFIMYLFLRIMDLK